MADLRRRVGEVPVTFMPWGVVSSSVVRSALLGLGNVTGVSTNSMHEATINERKSGCLINKVIRTQSHRMRRRALHARLRLLNDFLFRLLLNPSWPS